MTLDEAIKHAEEVAESCEIGNPKKRSKSKCAAEHKQLAEWLKELKAYKEQQPCDDAISRKAALEAILTRVPDFCGDEGGNLVGRNETASYIRNLPSVIPKQKTRIVRCKNCSYFEYDHVMNIDGVPLIVAHEFCTRWGDGCKTSENGFCFLGKEKEVNK